MEPADYQTDPDTSCDQCGQQSRRLAATCDLVDALRAVIMDYGDRNVIEAARAGRLL